MTSDVASSFGARGEYSQRTLPTEIVKNKINAVFNSFIVVQQFKIF